jgi:hypothetical protein
MPKRVKALVSVVVAILLLTVAGTAAVLADEEPAPEPDAGKGLLARIVEILNEQGYSVTEEALVDAFNQAQQEMREQFRERTRERECITQEQLERIRERWQERRQKACDQFLEKATKKGCITQDEAAEIEKWWDDRPPALDQLLPRPRIFKAIRAKQMQQQGILPMQGGPACPPWLNS